MPYNPPPNLQGRTYRVRFSATGITVSDQHGYICEDDESRVVALALAEAYAPGAYIYVGLKDVLEQTSSEAYHCKIGMSFDLRRRQQELGIKIVHAIPCANSKLARIGERLLHSVFEGFCIADEWFALDEEDIEELMKLRTYEDVVGFYKDQTDLIPIYRDRNTIEDLFIPPKDVHEIKKFLRYCAKVQKDNDKFSNPDFLKQCELVAEYFQQLAQEIKASTSSSEDLDEAIISQPM